MYEWKFVESTPKETERSEVEQRGRRSTVNYESLLKALRRVDLNIAELLNSSTVQNEIDWLNLTRDKMTGAYKNILFAKEYRETCDDPR